MTETNKAVFLSYASQDAEAARKICEALRGAGVEVWLDQSELVGGDAWDAKIRKQIAERAWFVPLTSVETQERLEGYYRIEWRLAAQRTHAMSDDTATDLRPNTKRPVPGETQGGRRPDRSPRPRAGVAQGASAGEGGQVNAQRSLHS
jgi:hypothetical protein